MKLHSKLTIWLASLSLLALLPAAGQAVTLASRLKGYVLLQVQSHGEAWYVNPVDLRRYYLRDGPAAYQIMRLLGLGISNSDLTRLLAGDATMKARLLGRILLQVEAHGEAYYICPRDKTVIYIKDGPAAYQVMRNCSLGITNSDLNLISTNTLPGTVTPPSPTPAPGPTPTPVSGSAAQFAGCQIFPADNPWNEDISNLPVHPDSQTFLNSIGLGLHLHPDFGANPDYGIPFNVVSGSQPKVPINFDAYGDESDPGPYPVPANAAVEAGSDRHALVLEKDSCTLYELYDARKDSSGSGWTAGSGAVWDLHSNKLRPETWTSADAAGLPIFPGLIKYDEVAAGVINHAIRFTASRSQRGYIHPATHYAGSADSTLPPMGLRIRLKANFDTSSYTGEALIILQAMKKYGLILADNGSSWYFQGGTDPRWNDDELNQLKKVPATAFEAVYTGDIIK